MTLVAVFVLGQTKFFDCANVRGQVFLQYIQFPTFVWTPFVSLKDKLSYLWRKNPLLNIVVPRKCHCEFEPIIVVKHIIFCKEIFICRFDYINISVFDHDD